MVNSSGQQQGESPQFQAAPFKSYRDLRADFLENPLFGNCAACAPKWPGRVGPHSGQGTRRHPGARETRQLVLPNLFLRSASVDDASVAALASWIRQSRLVGVGASGGGHAASGGVRDGTSETFALLVTSGVIKSAR